MWSAPELLRMQESELPPNGTQKGDIYSFAIILQEIIFRALPYFMDSGSLSPKGMDSSLVFAQRHNLYYN